MNAANELLCRDSRFFFCCCCCLLVCLLQSPNLHARKLVFVRLLRRVQQLGSERSKHAFFAIVVFAMQQSDNYFVLHPSRFCLHAIIYNNYACACVCECILSCLKNSIIVSIPTQLSWILKLIYLFVFDATNTNILIFPKENESVSAGIEILLHAVEYWRNLFKLYITWNLRLAHLKMGMLKFHSQIIIIFSHNKTLEKI